MGFNSLSFLFLLSGTLLLHHALPWRYGRWMLLASSYLFYGVAHPLLCLLLLASTLIDFVIAIRIHESASSVKRKILLSISVLFGIGVLTCLKAGMVPELRSLLLVGVSFYTFQTLSYVIDVYRGKIAPSRDLCEFALFVAFFPQLVAGPIERAGKLLPQLRQKNPVTASDIEAGFERMLFGYAKKLVFADRLGIYVDPVWMNGGAGSAETVLAVVCFSLQLYLDFSAYTDIAIGTGRMMGVQLSENFRWPYIARNPSDFWSRWHITLTSWFRDYVYRPLGGTQPSRPVRTVVNILVVMSLVGLWHGLSWNYLAFGFLSGLLLAIYQCLRLFRERRSKHLFAGRRGTVIAWVLAFCAINFIMVFFRSNDIAQAMTVLQRIFAFNGGWSGQSTFYLLLASGLMIGHFIGAFSHEKNVHFALPGAVRGVFWAALFLLVIFGYPDQTQPFIYFQF